VAASGCGGRQDRARDDVEKARGAGRERGPAVDSTFPLADARKAHERAARGHLQGKIVLTVG
jgi:NADPH:quinone reductase-like Zn-dependent oxidoreductase